MLTILPQTKSPVLTVWTPTLPWPPELPVWTASCTANWTSEMVAITLAICCPLLALSINSTGGQFIHTAPLYIIYKAAALKDFDLCSVLSMFCRFNWSQVCSFISVAIGDLPVPVCICLVLPLRFYSVSLPASGTFIIKLVPSGVLCRDTTCLLLQVTAVTNLFNVHLLAHFLRSSGGLPAVSPSTALDRLGTGHRVPSW